MKTVDERKDAAQKLRESVDKGLKATITPLDLISGMIHEMSIQGMTSFPYVLNDPHMVQAFKKLFEDVPEFFEPLGVKNKCGKIYPTIYGTSQVVSKMFQSAISMLRLLNIDDTTGRMYIVNNAEYAEAMFDRSMGLPGNRATYTELVRRFGKYYDEARAK